MGIQKECKSREAFEEFEFQKRPFASKKVLFQKYDPERIGDCDGNEGKYYCTEMQEKWEIWQHIESQAIPEGFVLVPKEPTFKMAFNYAKHSIVSGRSLSLAGYKAMIKAAEGK